MYYRYVCRIYSILCIGVMNSRTVWNARLINLVFLQMSVIVP